LGYFRICLPLSELNNSCVVSPEKNNSGLITFSVISIPENFNSFISFGFNPIYFDFNLFLII
jgi:hypothetical protein